MGIPGSDCLVVRQADEASRKFFKVKLPHESQELEMEMCQSDHPDYFAYKRTNERDGSDLITADD